MAKQVTFTLQHLTSGDGRNDKFLLPTETYPAANPKEETVTLASGNNSIAVPDGVSRVTIVPPEGSDVTKLLKWAAPDDGLEIGPDVAFSMGVPAGKTTLVINADGPEDVDLYWA